VKDACAGLNSLFSLTAISLFYIYLRHNASWRYALFLLLLVVPIAVFANIMRVIILVLITHYWGEAAAQGFLHNSAGMLMFVIALLGIFAIDSAVEFALRRRHAF
jgi:exosortase/archaeosortase family protein